MTTRLKGLEVQEVSLVDDPAVPDARYLITKRNTVTAEGMTDINKDPSLAERLGKAVFNMLGGQPADENTRALIAKHLADAEAEGAEGAEGEAEAETEKSAEGAEAEGEANEKSEGAESEAEKAEGSEAAEGDSAESEAEKARPKCETCGQYLPAEGDDRHKSAEAEAETEKSAEAEAEGAAPALTREDVASIVAEAMKSVSEQIGTITEAMGKSLDAQAEIASRVEAMETRKGVSKSLKGNDVSSGTKGTFESVIF